MRKTLPLPCGGENAGARWGISNKEQELFVEKLKSLDLGLESRLSAKVGPSPAASVRALTL